MPAIPTIGQGNGSSNGTGPCLTINEKYALPAISAALGPSRGVERPTQDGGRFHNYQFGAMYSKANNCAYEIHGEIYVKWVALGGLNYLGYPVSDVTDVDGGGKYSLFENGVIYWTTQTGAHEVHGAILDKWDQLGGVYGPLASPQSLVNLGYPLTDEMAAPRNGRVNTFENGVIYLTAQTGAHEVHGAIRAKWESLGGVGREPGGTAGQPPEGFRPTEDVGAVPQPLGYPLTDESIIPGGIGRFSRFEKGTIYWTAEEGAHVVYGQGPLAPMDLVWDKVDDNYFPKNPKWGYQVMFPNSLPVLEQVCPPLALGPSLGNYLEEALLGFTLPCTTQKLGFDNGGLGPFTCGPHINWYEYAATYEGGVWWGEKSRIIEDDDYTLEFAPPNNAGLVRGRLAIELEFDSDETIDHFQSPWWQAFHDLVDRGAEAFILPGNYCIVTGLVGLDCGHKSGCSPELHPVWAIAIQSYLIPHEEVWGMFVRNYGNEGLCGSHQHYLDVESYTFRLPWKPEATDVTILWGDNETVFFTNLSEGVTGPNIQIIKNEAILVNFTFPPLKWDEVLPKVVRIHGEVHLQWVGEMGVIDTASRLSEQVAFERQEQKGEDKPEHQLRALVEELSSEQRRLLMENLPRKNNSLDTFRPLCDESPQYITHLPALEAASAKPGPYIKAVPDSRKARHDLQKIAGLYGVFGDKWSEVLEAASINNQASTNQEHGQELKSKSVGAPHLRKKAKRRERAPLKTSPAKVDSNADAPQKKQKRRGKASSSDEPAQ